MRTVKVSAVFLPSVVTLDCSASYHQSAGTVSYTHLTLPTSYGV